MNLKRLLKQTLLVAMMLTGGGNFAWAETTTVGADDNSAGWWTAFSDYYTLSPNQTLTISFKNYTDKANNAYNWVAVVTTDADRQDTDNGYAEYFVLRADNYGWGSVWDANCLSSYYNWNTFKDDMDGSSVVMTVKRVGPLVSIHADITASDGTTKYWEKYYANCGNGSQNIRFFLTTQAGHLTDISSSIANTSIEQRSVITWDFTASTSENANIASSENGTVKITVGTRKNIDCALSNTGILTEGLYFWDSWKLYNGYFQNVSKGDRIMVIPGLLQGDIITFKSESGVIVATSNSTYSAYDETEGTYTITANADGNVGIGVNKNKKIYSISVKRVVENGAPANPTYTVTGASGTSRKFMLNSATDGSTLYYSTTKKTVGSSEWTLFSSEATTDANKIFAYAVKDGKASAITELETGAGTAIALKAPMINRTNSTKVTFSSNQDDILGAPTATIYYRVGESGEFSEYSSEITVSSANTVYAYAANADYDNSATVSQEIGFVSDLTQIESVSRITSYTSGGLDLDNGITVGSLTYYPFVYDGKQWGSNIYFQNAGWGFRSGNTWYNNGASSTNSWLLLREMKKDDIIVVRINEGALAMNNSTYSEKYSYPGHYAYVVAEDGNVTLRFQRTASKSNNILYGIDKYTTASSISQTITAAGWATLYSPYALDFSSLSSSFKAYTATLDESTVTLTEVSDVPANTGVVLKGAAGTYDVPLVASSETAKGSLEGNATEATAYDAFDGFDLYMLKMNASSEAQFAKVTSGSIAAGKAFLKVSSGSSARAFNVVFADETTGIAVVSRNGAGVSSEVYNLQGQRVKAPKSGLYIKSGKKVIIK